jgi:hypothetical protein
MPRRRHPTIFIPVINLENGMPPVHQALAHLDRELAAGREHRHAIVKLIHGYGETFASLSRNAFASSRIEAPSASASSGKTGP